MNYLNSTDREDIRVAAAYLMGEALGVTDFKEDLGWDILDKVFESVVTNYAERESFR